MRGKGSYYIPSSVSKHDYICNYLNDSVSNLWKDWNLEYKPLFDKIFSPKDAENSHRISALATISDSELFDDAELGSKYAAFKRMKTYYRIQAELHCVFIINVVIEIHRIILRALSMQLYEKPNYNVWDLVTYCNGKDVSFFSLKNCRVYLKYNNICNFLKHNSVSAYKTLKEHNPECLREINKEYENGMFAVEWINFKEVNIEKFLSDIRPFLEDFCVKVLGEDLKQAEWDHDEHFMEIFNELKDPEEHFGIHAAVGRSPWS